MSARETLLDRWLRWRALALTLAAFALSFGVLLASIEVGAGGDDEPAFHVDEAHKLSEAYYYHLFFERGDLAHPDWNADFYARSNPPIAKYVFGAALALAGEHVVDRSLQDDFEALWRTPSELRKRVPDGRLRVTRRVSALYGALACAVLFYVAYRAAAALAGPWTGAAAGSIAVALVLANPDFAATARRGLTDTILLFHLALIAPVAMVASDALARWWSRARAPSVRAHIALAVRTVLMPGVVIALATGSKLNGALTAPIFALALLAAAARPRAGAPAPRRRVGLVLALIAGACAVALALFVAANPRLHSDPLGRALETRRVFDDWMLCQQIHPGEGLYSLRERVGASGHALFTGPTAPLARWLGGAGAYVGALAALGGISFLVLARRREDAGATDSALAWCALVAGAVTVWLPVAWDRYYLPPFLAAAVLIGVGTAVAASSAVLALRAARESGFARPRARAVAGALLAAAGAVALIATAWGHELELAPERADVPRDVAWWKDSPRLRRHLGLQALHHGRAELARAEFERAIELVGPDPGDRSANAVERCVLLNELAILLFRIGEPRAAAEALAEHIRLLERFRERMRSDDPHVRASATVTIDERKQDLARLLEWR